MTNTAFDIRLPLKAQYAAAKEEYFFLTENGQERKIMLQDYVQMYNIPQLYEYFVYKHLNYNSPAVLSKLLMKQVEQANEQASDLIILEIGAGSGLMGKQLKALGVPSIIGTDIIPQAKSAALRDAPEVYESYFVEDLAELSKKTTKVLTNRGFNCLVCCSALSHIPTMALVNTYNMVTKNGWIAFNILKEAWEDQSFVKKNPWMTKPEIFELKDQYSYLHRTRTNGDAIEYVAFVGIKKGEIDQISLPHPWNIQLSQEASDDKVVYQKLVDYHLRGQLQIGDKITGYKSTSLNNIAYFAKTFAGEFKVEEKTEASGLIRLTKTLPEINANIRPNIPTSSEELEAELSQYGHTLIRTGMPIAEAVIQKLLIGKGKIMEYNRYGTTARKKVKNSKAVEVTPWTKELLLPAHSEMTHHTNFPKNMAFTCIEPAEYGGETAIYDCAKAFELLSPTLKEKVQTHDVICRKRYVKDTSDLRYISWKQAVGEEATIEEVMAHFTSIGYQCEHIQEEENGRMLDIVEISLVRPMTYYYQNKTCLHISMVPLTPFWYWQVWPGKTPPLRVTWDNNEPLTYEEFYELDEAILLARIRYNGWQKHDVLIVDNPRVAHGRLPYIGDRTMTGLMAQPARFVQKKEQWQVEILN